MSLISRLMGLNGTVAAPQKRVPQTHFEKAVRNERVVADIVAGMSFAAAAIKYGLASETIRQIVWRSGTKPPRKPQPRAKEMRNEEIVEKYKAGASSVELAKEYGVSRERICQFLRKDNVIATKQQRNALAREMAKADVEARKAQFKAERQEKIDAALALVRQGKSLREAGAEIGLTHYEGNILQIERKRAGIVLKHGRWRDFGPRKARIRELYDQGKGRAEIIRTLRAEGDPLHDYWLRDNCADLKFRKRGQASRQKKIREPRPDPESIWTDDKVSELRRHWLNGLSAQQISDIFGLEFTRNSIIGKVNRLRNAGQVFLRERE